jgi:hypothetical protein
MRMQSIHFGNVVISKQGWTEAKAQSLRELEDIDAPGPKIVTDILPPKKDMITLVCDSDVNHLVAMKCNSLNLTVINRS